MSGNKELRCYNSSISGRFQQHRVGHIKTHSIADSLEKRANDKEKRKRKTKEKANAMLTRLAAHRLNPQAAPNSEAAEEAASMAQFEHGRSTTSVFSSNSAASTSSATFLNEGDIAFVAHYQRLDTEGENEESEFRLRFAEEEEDEDEDEEIFEGLETET
jgi:hypothetical protein